MGDTSPSPSSSPTVPQDLSASAQAPAPASEITPLLPPGTNPDPALVASQADSPPYGTESFVHGKRLVILTLLSLVLSIASIASIIATSAALNHAPAGFYLQYSVWQPIENVAPIVSYPFPDAKPFTTQLNRLYPANLHSDPPGRPPLLWQPPPPSSAQPDITIHPEFIFRYPDHFLQRILSDPGPIRNY